MLRHFLFAILMPNILFYGVGPTLVA